MPCDMLVITTWSLIVFSLGCTDLQYGLHKKDINVAPLLALF